MNNQKDDMGENIKKATDALMKEGFSKRTSTYAAAMGYLRSQKKK